MCSKHVSSWTVVLYNCVSRVLDMYKSKVLIICVSLAFLQHALALHMA